jgi:hypothetical protein
MPVPDPLLLRKFYSVGNTFNDNILTSVVEYLVSVNL